MPRTFRTSKFDIYLSNSIKGLLFMFSSSRFYIIFVLWKNSLGMDDILLNINLNTFNFLHSLTQIGNYVSKFELRSNMMRARFYFQSSVIFSILFLLISNFCNLSCSSNTIVGNAVKRLFERSRVVSFAY
jgi:hypothetical protein